MGYSEEQVANVKYIGLLHDIGKIGIPDSILNKPGRLTDTEYAIMRKHAEIGGNILSGNKMIDGLDEGARFHHERYDGRGYPLGLAGENIPEMARIIGIADAYDTMTSNRVYRKRLTDEDVISEIKRCAGSQFDPKLTEIFVKMIENGKLSQLSPDTAPITRKKPMGMAERSAELLRSVIGFKEKPYDSEHDYLTGVYSKVAGEKLITDILAEEDGGLFIADITNLQEVNLKYGIVAGDRIIKLAAETLSSCEGLTTVRYDGSGFLCFAKGITERAELEALMVNICEGFKKIRMEMPEYEDNFLCIGGVLSCEVGRDFPKLLIDADKAMFYIKQLKQDGAYLYQKLEKGGGKELYGLDLEQLIKMIMHDDSGEKAYSTDSPEFIKIFDLVKNVYEETEQEVQLALLTVTPAAGKSPSISDRDEAMQYLQNAIDITVDQSCVRFRFSSVQCMVILAEPDGEAVKQVIERIFNSFYKSYDKSSMALSYEIEYLPPAETALIE